MCTFAGISSGIDMALIVVSMLYGDDVARSIELTMEYDPEYKNNSSYNIRNINRSCYLNREKRVSQNSDKFTLFKKNVRACLNFYSWLISFYFLFSCISA